MKESDETYQRLMHVLQSSIPTITDPTALTDAVMQGIQPRTNKPAMRVYAWFRILTTLAAACLVGWLLMQQVGATVVEQGAGQSRLRYQGVAEALADTALTDAPTSNIERYKAFMQQHERENKRVKSFIELN